MVEKPLLREGVSAMKGISTQTLQQSLDVYYQRLTNWNTTEEKRQQYLKRIDEITDELNKREVA
jgi:hypothetical protein